MSGTALLSTRAVPRGRSGLIHHRFDAMGTSVVTAVTDTAAGLRIEEWFTAVESQLSRFIATSDLERLNRDPSPRVELSTLLADVMAAADRVRTRTGSLVDVAVGAAVRAWGYDRTFAQVSDRPGNPPPPSPPGSRRTPVWSLEGQVIRRTPGTRIDLGGVAKGWAADRVVTSGDAWMVSVGGDVRSAHRGTIIDILDPAGSLVVRAALGEGALATSSTTHRTWRVGDEVVHHLIDPRSGRPARSPIVQATVVAGNAVDAEAGAKAVILHGAAGLAWADGQPWIRGALSIWSDGAVYATTGFPVAA